MTTKNIEKPAVRLMSESIIRYFQRTNKKHIIITGSKGIGKSTLANNIFHSELMSDINSTHFIPVPKLETIGIPKKYVKIVNVQSNTSSLIGVYKDNMMMPINDGFINTGISTINDMIISNSSWAFIDELGFLESSCPQFQHKIYELLDKKNVIAVLRKQSTEFLDSIKNRSDVFVYDLDTPVLPVGCIIMASGEGKRFGSNKLMTAFKGKPLISHIIDKTGNDLFSERIVVTRHNDIYIFCKNNNIPVLLHNCPHRNDTIRLGLSKLLEFNPLLSGCLFTVSDQPLLTRTSIENLVLSFSQNNKMDTIAALSNNNIPGNPVLFGADYFNDLLNLPEKKGGQYVLKQNFSHVITIPSLNDNELFDIDTKEDLLNLENY